MSINRFSLAGKTVLITGASSGIGYGVAKGLAQAGATIVATARRTVPLEQLVAEIEADGGQAIALKMDVTDLDSINQALDQAENSFSTIDILINNAGVADPKPFLQTDQDSLDFVMNTNFKGVWNVAQQVALRMVKAEQGGSIINIASILGLGTRAGYSSYSSSKAAVIQLTRSLALDLCRYGIRVNAIAPGWFTTEINQELSESEQGKAYIKQTPARRSGNISELIGPIIMLASDAGSFVNGVVLPVDGAHSVTLV